MFVCYSAESVMSKTCLLLSWEPKALISNFLCLQLVSGKGQANLFSSYTNDEYRLVRKGITPAFSPKNIRWV